MAHLQTVTGFFDDITEAQQAVQFLLNSGFTAECVNFSTLNNYAVLNNRPTGPTTKERATGRFFNSLFGDINETLCDTSSYTVVEKLPASGTSTLVKVHVQSTPEVDRAVILLNQARPVTISNPTE